MKERLNNNLSEIYGPILENFIYEQLPVNIFVSDKDGYVIWANTRAVETLKATKETFIGEHLSKWGEENWNNCKRVIETGVEHKEEEIGVDNHIYLTNRKPFFNKDKSAVLGVIGVSLDITEERKSDIAKEALLENARHDIRTPFSGIIGFAHLVHSTNDINKIKEYTKDLVLSTEEFLEYHNKLLEAIKVADTASGIFQKKKINLIEEMASVIDINKLSAITKGIELDLIYDKNILAYPYFISDPIQVHRIALELVTNAIKFTEKEKVELKVNIKKKDLEKSIIEISVSDTGIGIPADKQEEIFFTFNRLSPSYKGIYKGAGLGLSIVKQFVDNLSGEIFVESEEGKGSTIGCYIPFQNPLIVNSEQK